MTPGRTRCHRRTWTEAAHSPRRRTRPAFSQTSTLARPILTDGSDALKVLDAGCGQGTKAIAVGRLGHTVVGVDVSEKLLDHARRAAENESEAVRRRLSFQRGDLLDLTEHFGRYDLVCCHGVAVYLPSLTETASALVATARPGGLVSILTRNRAGLPCARA
jgi:2-polyprenyl-3-methyl-5-hydroxy-6-metoxy-1,4-benzoquinol methylase